MTNIEPSRPPFDNQPEFQRLFPYVYTFVAIALAFAYFLFAIFAYQQWDKIVGVGYDRATSATTRILDEQLKKANPGDFDLVARVALEQDTAHSRASHVRSMILMRTWLRFVSVMVGSVLSIVGALFVFGRINSNASDSAQIDGGGISVLLTTTWPGLVLALIGGALVAIPNISVQEIEWRDSSVYLVGAPVYQTVKPRIDHTEAIKTIEDAFRPTPITPARASNDTATAPKQ